MNKPRVMWLSDNPCTTTGFSNISMNIMNGLTNDFECHYLAHNFIGQPLAPPIKFKSGDVLDFFMHGGGLAPYCQDVITQRIRENNIQIFGILLDTFMLHGDYRQQYGWFLNVDTAPAKTIFYFPSDGGGGLPLYCDNILRKVTTSVAMSKFAQKQVKDYHNIDCEYIPHATNPTIFNPMFKKEIKLKYGLQDKFVVGSVFRNQGRKMADRTIKMFAKFAKGKDDVVLLLHTDPADVAAPNDLMSLIARYNIQNKVVFTGTKFFKGFSYLEMGEVYKPMDVFLLSTSGEGFGVPIIEAMSCEVPCLVTDYTTTQELVKDHKAGLGINLVGCQEMNPFTMDMKIYDEIVDNTLTGTWNVERGICDINDGANKLTMMYLDYKDEGKLLKEFGTNGRKAVLQYYTWDVVNKSWKELMEKMLND